MLRGILHKWSDNWQMKSNLKIFIMKIVNGKNMLNYNYHTSGNKLLESTCDRNLGDGFTRNISPENHARRVMRHTNYILANVKVSFKCVDKEMFKMISSTYDRHKLEYPAVTASPPHCTKSF